MVASVGQAAAQTVTVGSKNFGESYLLAEIAAQVLEAQGLSRKSQVRSGWYTDLL